MQQHKHGIKSIEPSKCGDYVDKPGYNGLTETLRKRHGGIYGFIAARKTIKTLYELPCLERWGGLTVRGNIA